MSKKNFNNIYINNTLIFNKIRTLNNLKADVRYELDVAEKSSSEETLVWFYVSNNLSNFDLDVADAIFTLYYDIEQELITPNKVLQVLSLDETQRVKASNEKAILNSIRLLMKTTIKIYCKNHFDLYKNEDDFINNDLDIQAKFLEKENPFLYLKECDNKKEFLVASLEKFPYFVRTTQGTDENYILPIYGYAGVTKQMICFPKELLACSKDTDGKTISNTLTFIAIKRYIMRRLEIERVKREHSSNIRKNKKKDVEEKKIRIVYIRQSHQSKNEHAIRNADANSIDGMFARVGIIQGNLTEEVWKKKRLKLHKLILSYLEYLKRLSYIKDYETLMDDRKIYGIEIKGKIKRPKWYHEM